MLFEQPYSIGNLLDPIFYNKKLSEESTVLHKNPQTAFSLPCQVGSPLSCYTGKMPAVEGAKCQMYHTQLFGRDEYSI